MALQINKTITELTECYKASLMVGNNRDAQRILENIEKLIKYATGV